jgi:hypothetical protein
MTVVALPVLEAHHRARKQSEPGRREEQEHHAQDRKRFLEAGEAQGVLQCGAKAGAEGRVLRVGVGWASVRAKQGLLLFIASAHRGSKPVSERV